MVNLRRGVYGWFGGAIFVMSGMAQASIESACQYDHIPQGNKEYLDIQITATDSKKRDWRAYETESGELMPTWLARHSPAPLYAVASEVEGRKARLLHQEFVEQEEDRWGVKERARYYAAHTENCQRLFLRVPVEYQPFKGQLHAEDDRADGGLDFSTLQNSLDMVLKKDWEEAKSYEGKTIIIIPNQKGGMTMLSHDRRQRGYATPYTWFTVTGVSRHALSVGEEKLSGFHLLVKDREDNVWRMPWQPERFYQGNPLHKKDVRKKYHDAIREGRLIEGMNSSEVELVTGPPIWERYYPIYRDEHGQRRFVVDEGYRKDGFRLTNRHLPMLEDTPIGQEMGWFFPEIMGKENHLRFNEKGLLDMTGQSKESKAWLEHNWLDRYHPE